MPFWKSHFRHSSLVLHFLALTVCLTCVIQLVVRFITNGNIIIKCSSRCHFCVISIIDMIFTLLNCREDQCGRMILTVGILTFFQNSLLLSTTKMLKPASCHEIASKIHEHLYRCGFSLLSPVKTRGYRVGLVRLSVCMSVRLSVPLEIGYFVHASWV